MKTALLTAVGDHPMADFLLNFLNQARWANFTPTLDEMLAFVDARGGF